MLLQIIVRDCLLVSAVFGLMYLVIWCKKRNIVQTTLEVYEVLVDAVNQHVASEITNDYNKLPDLHKIQQDMNFILEKSEDNMNDGDYLEVANKLKMIFGDVKQLESLADNPGAKYIKQDVIVESHLDYYQDISFRLSREELRTLMTNRIRERDINMIVSLNDYLEECSIELNNIRKYKKECWIALQAMSNGLTKKNLRSEHKLLVEAEKKKIGYIRRMRERIYILETRLGSGGAS